ncbi:hypothetical protein KC19_2G075100 [Ceratodon purpureus]|uniref:Uncharacterized protein n=1 Tax=Ceratodon purpureus TaxID=3225 RepID=A0A8T0IT39_CERPU|nr:hypothetical protein KC19_2G075100 [Ceratodon purpureus]
MMQCAVTRRKLSGRKRANLMHGPRNPGLATLIASPGVEQCEGPHSDHQPVEGNTSDNPHEKDASNVAEKMGGGQRKRAYGEASLNSGPLQRVCLANNVRQYPYSKVAEIREARRASLDRKSVTRKHIAPPMLLPLSPLDRHRVVPEMLTADDATGKFAYISLDGRLINAELATSATKIGGSLGAEEAKAWEDFAPMYRVLIVALSAAASAAAKDNNSLEIQRLLKIVTEQEKELVLMRQQLSEQLAIQDITDPACLASRTEAVEWASSAVTAGNFQSSKISGDPELGDLGCVRGDEMKNVEAPGRADANSSIDLQLSSPLLVDVSLEPRGCHVLSKDLDITRDDAINKNVVLVETPFRREMTSSLPETNSLIEKCADDEEKWYVNPMVDATEDYDDMCTPERESPLFSTCTPAIRRSVELTALRSSIRKGGKWISDSRLSPLVEFSPASPLQVIPCRLSKESVTPVLDNRCIEEEVTALRVECAAAVLKLKTKVMTVLRREGARCITERNLSATEGKALVASLLSAVARCWRDTVPQALAALGLSPSEYNSCLLNNTQRKKPNVSECARDTDGWRQFLEEHDTNEQEVEQQSNRGATLCLCASNFEQLSVCTSSKDDVPEESPGKESPEKESPKRESMYLLRAPEADEESTSSLIKVHGQGGEDESNSRISDIYSENSAESQGKFISCWESPAEWLDKASAEVADMEMQMKRLQQDVSEYEAERQYFESKLTENIHLENQVKLHGDIVELGARLQMKEFQIAEIAGPIQMKRNHEARIVDLAEMRRELQWKESKIAELTTVVQSKERVIADLENYKANMYTDLEEMARRLQSKEYDILELRSQVQLKGLEIADLERKLKAKLNLDVSEMTQQIQLIESKFVELTTRLHLKDVEIADLERAQKVILMAKDEELSALQEDRVLSDAHLDEVAAAAQATETAYSDRISALEDLCSRKDYTIFELKQELRALETKINKSKPMQSPAMLRGKRSFVSYVPPPISKLEGVSSDSPKQYVLKRMLSPPSSTMEGPVYQHLDLKDTSSNESDSPRHSQPPLKVSDDLLSGSEFHLEKILISTSNSSDKESQSDLEVSNQIVQDNMGNDTMTEICNPHDDKNSRISTNGVQSAEPRTPNNLIKKPKKGTADPSRVRTSSTGNVANRNRVRASMTFTSAANLKPGSKIVSKNVANPVVIRKRVTISPRRLGQANMKVLGPVPPNTPVRNPKSSSIDQKHGVNSLVGAEVSIDARTKENSAIKRRRWAG